MFGKGATASGAARSRGGVLEIEPLRLLADSGRVANGGGGSLMLARGGVPVPDGLAILPRDGSWDRRSKPMLAIN